MDSEKYFYNTPKNLDIHTVRQGRHVVFATKSD